MFSKKNPLCWGGGSKNQSCFQNGVKHGLVLEFGETTDSTIFDYCWAGGGRGNKTKMSLSSVLSPNMKEFFIPTTMCLSSLF